MSTKEVERKVKELRKLQAMIEEAQQEAESIKDELKALMGDTEELRAGEYKVTYKFVKSERLDTMALRVTMPEIAARSTKTTLTRRFCVA